MLFVKKPHFIIYLSIIIAISTLLIVQPSIAATYTAASGETTIQAAINAAISAGGSNEVRVQQGTYNENIEIKNINSDVGTLNITGGWNSAFTTRDTDYTLTTIDGGGTGRVLWIEIDTGGYIDLTLDGFTLQNGSNNTYGSGILIEADFEFQITINNNRILNNTSSGTDSIAGGGIFAQCTTAGVGILNITNNLIKGNSVTSSGGSVTGAGIDLSFSLAAVFNVTGNVFEDNTSTNNGYQAAGIGAYIYKTDSGSCDFSDNIIRNNTANGTGTRSGIAGGITITDSSTLTLCRNQWLNNTNNGGETSYDLDLFASGTSTLTITDSLVAGADYHGIQYSTASSTSFIRMTNLTITDNGAKGLRQGSTSGTSSLYNTILYNNGTNYDTLPGDTGNNLIGTDPKFVDSTSYNYRLRPGSSAINAGTNSPSGDLGTLDLDGKERISKSTVDIGAYEFSPAINSGVLLMLLN